MKKILTILLTAILSIGAFNAKASSGEGEESGKIDTRAPAMGGRFQSATI